MNVIFSIQKPFTDYIFDGTKNLEFRKQIGKEIKPGDTIFIYETRKNNGAGKVVGAVHIKEIINIPKSKVGTYFILPWYVKKYGTKEEQDIVENAMSIKLSHYDPSIVLDYLYDPLMLKHMKEHNDVPDIWEHPYTERFSSAAEYNESKKMADALCKRADEWAAKIGFYNSYDTSNWNYAIEMEDVKKYETPIEINSFKLRNNKNLKAAPQSWCYTICEM